MQLNALLTLELPSEGRGEEFGAAVQPLNGDLTDDGRSFSLSFSISECERARVRVFFGLHRYGLANPEVPTEETEERTRLACTVPHPRGTPLSSLRS